MSTFRCAYCHQSLGEEPPKGPCPSCGKRMLVPEKLQKTPFRRRQRRRLLIERQVERALAQDSGAGMAATLTRNNPMFIFIAVGLFLVLGSALVSRSCVVSKVQTGTSRKQETATRELAALYGGLEGFKYDCGFYPDESNGLKGLVLKLGNPKWNGPYVNFLRSDPWRHPYYYRLQGTGFVLKSLGPDGVESIDDIHMDGNWTSIVEVAAQPPVLNAK